MCVDAGLSQLLRLNAHLPLCLLPPGGSDGGESGARPKRGRAAGEVHAVQDPSSNQVLITTASKQEGTPNLHSATDTDIAQLSSQQQFGSWSQIAAGPAIACDG